MVMRMSTGMGTDTAMAEDCAKSVCVRVGTERMEVCASFYSTCAGELHAYTIGRAQRGLCRKKPLPQREYGYTLRYRLMAADGALVNICAECLSLYRDVRDVMGKPLKVKAVGRVDLTVSSMKNMVAVYDVYDEGPPLVCEDCFQSVRATYGRKRPATLFN